MKEGNQESAITRAFGINATTISLREVVASSNEKGGGSSRVHPTDFTNDRIRDIKCTINPLVYEYHQLDNIVLAACRVKMGHQTWRDAGCGGSSAVRQFGRGGKGYCEGVK